jgi:hypothetical protein
MLWTIVDRNTGNVVSTNVEAVNDQDAMQKSGVSPVDMYFARPSDPLADFTAKLGEQIPTDERAVLDAGGGHDYKCTCSLCKRWWVLVGPDGGEPGNYGGFSRNEVVAEAIAWGKPTEYLL